MTTKWHIAILCSFILAACSGQEHAEQDLELSLVDDMPIALENNSMQNMHLTKMLEAMEYTMRSTTYCAMIKQDHVRRFALHGAAENEEKLIYQATVFETYRGKEEMLIEYEMVVEKGEDAPLEPAPAIICLCVLEGKYYWPGTGSIFPADVAHVTKARELSAVGFEGSPGTYCKNGNN